MNYFVSVLLSRLSGMGRLFVKSLETDQKAVLEYYKTAFSVFCRSVLAWLSFLEYISWRDALLSRLPTMLYPDKILFMKSY